MKFAAFAGLSGASASTLGITFQDCGDSTTHGKISDLQPLSITSGVENSLTGTGSLDKSITGGAFDMHVTAGGGLINKHYTGDVCESKTFSLPLGLGTMSWGGLACPQATGDVAVVLKVKLSSNLPASLATSDVALTATDQDSESAICANVHIAKQMEFSAKKYARGLIHRNVDRAVPIEVETITDEMRANTPTSKDWSGVATTAVKDQGYCGSCWAYSATEGIESGLFMSSGELLELSPQQIISCDKTDGGCNGGDIPEAFDYVMSTGGIALDSDYPETSAGFSTQFIQARGFWRRIARGLLEYLMFKDLLEHFFGSNGKCKSHPFAVQVSSAKFAIPECTASDCSGNAKYEDDLKAALAKHGPMSICVNAASWDSYTGGIFTESCPGGWGDLDHCVQLVGYGTDSGSDYWKVRNSWASNWGEGGYIRLPVGTNACGVATEAMFVKASKVSLSV